MHFWLWIRLEPKTPSPQVFTALTVATQAIITREGLCKYMERLTV